MKSKLLKIVLLVLLATILSTSPVLAIANPDSITITSFEVFQNIFETGDMLFVAEYDIAYASPPTEPATTAFQFNLMNTTGTTVTLNRVINAYQENLISIYVTAAQVSSLSLVWGTAYKIRITGNPALFVSLVEGTNMITKTLQTSDYNPDGEKTSKELLRLYLLEVVNRLEIALSKTYLVTNADGTEVLNSDGRVLILDAIPSLDKALLDLFKTTTKSAEITRVTPLGTYETETAISTKLGTSIDNAFSGIGTWLGITKEWAAGIWAMLFMLSIASIVFLNSGNVTGATILTVPIAAMLTYLGAIPLALTYTVTILVVAYMAYFIWLRGT